MFYPRRLRLNWLISTAMAGSLAFNGCKPVDKAAPPVPPPTVSAAQASPAAPTPLPAPAPDAPVLLSRSIWPTVELADGRVLEQVRVSAEDGASVTLRHAGGIAKVDKRALPPELAALHPYDSGAAQIEAQQATARREAAAKIAAARAAQAAAARRYTPAPVSAPEQPKTSTAAIERAVRARAHRYFKTEKRVGSGQTLVFDVLTDLSEPREVPGWSNRWEVTGTAGFKVYDSVNWGSFSTRSKKFSCTVEAAPGKRIVVLEFEERS